jgi:hypothetical protein
MTANNANKTKVLACATVIEEMLTIMPADYDHETLEFGLHINPEALRVALQEAIDAANGTYDTLILGYGFCSQAVVGLEAKNCTLVIPKVHDCIAIFLGSGDEYNRQARQEPGTYYFTKGWIEVADTPFHEYDQVVEKYGKTRADRVMQLLLKNYKRLAFINTGLKDLDRYREHSKQTAEKFGLRYEEIQGKKDLVKQMLYGPWEDDFVVIPPGETSKYQHFFHHDDGPVVSQNG